MARYSVAITKNNLSSLIDKALAGEEVVITRHGKPEVLLSVVPVEPRKPKLNREQMRDALERLAEFRATLPSSPCSYIELKRMEQDEQEARFDL